jgi:hypothetical protein
MKAGEAIWIRSAGESTFPGPLSVTLEQGRSLDYGGLLTEQTLTVHNNSLTSHNISVTQLRSDIPIPGTSYPTLAGDVPLSFWKMLYPSNIGFFPFPAQLTKPVAPGGKWSIRLAVRRADMAAALAGISSSLYQSILLVSDGAGSQMLVPVTSEGLQPQTRSQVSGKRRPLDASSLNPRAGLWIGSAVLNKVSLPAGDPTLPLPTHSSDFEFRLILHVDNGGQVRLLQNVLQMWKTGTYTNDSNGRNVVDQPGYYVLLTKENLISQQQYSGSAMRDGQLLARRFSSVAFGFRDPISMAGAGDFGVDSSVFFCEHKLDYRDPLNPFLHRYHPDHNNLAEDFQTPLKEGEESFDVKRSITLQFTSEDPDNLKLSGWGDNQVGGIYKETISGLHKQAILVSGTFRLHQAVPGVGVLNDGQ